MCWYIIDTKEKSYAMDGELLAHQVYSKLYRTHGAQAKISPPRKADPYDLVDRSIIFHAERQQELFVS